MRRAMSVCLGGVAVLICASAVHAHHNSGLFDHTKPIRVRGVIVEARFANPHSMIFVDAVDADGKHVRWAVENSGTLAMTRDRGFDETTVQVGDPIEVCGYAPKRAYMSAKELADLGLPLPQPWWGNWDKVITGRLVVLKTGPNADYSHYGPLEACQALLESE